MSKYGLASVCLGAMLVAGCGNSEINEGPVDFTSEGAQTVRHRLCSQDWETAAHKGAGAETFNASTIWSVSPYQILVPTSGTGYFNLNVDAPHFDWLLYTRSDVQIESVEGAALELSGPVEECPELGFVEYGFHHQELTSWALRVNGDSQSRVPFYAGLAATEHSDPNEAGHAGHDLSGDENAPNHGGH